MELEDHRLNIRRIEFGIALPPHRALSAVVVRRRQLDLAFVIDPRKQHMILVIPADAAHVQDHRDAEGLQVVRWANPAS